MHFQHRLNNLSSPLNIILFPSLLFTSLFPTIAYTSQIKGNDDQLSFNTANSPVSQHF